MTKPRIFVTRIIPDDGMEKLNAACEVILWENDLPPLYDHLSDVVKEVDGLLCLITDRIDSALIAGAPNLKVISQMAVGVDNIDITAATQHGIPVGHTPGVLTDTSADFAFALLMAAARRVVEGERYIKAGKWETWSPRLLMGRDVYGATLGIIGMGRIGQAMAKRASGFDMRILYHNRSEVDLPDGMSATRCDIDTLLRESDFVSLHTPLTPETHHLINANALQMMKPTAILINTARGPVVDSAALYAALSDGEIAYAALDVTDPEPIPTDDPLLTLDNCLIAPHIASSSIATRNLMASMAADNLIAGLRGERLPNCVNPAVYD